MNNRGKRLTIGLLVSGISEQFTESICKGVMHSAREADVNLVVLPGKYIDRDLTVSREIMYEYQYNTVFEYAKADNIDAVIVVADIIGCFASKEKIGRFLEKFKGIPCILVASKFDGYVSVNYDNYQGIEDAMKYLIEEVGCIHFGMIGGPDDNTDASERKHSFFKILNEHNIPVEEKNYVVGNLSSDNRKATKAFLDNNPDIQVAFCVNDDTAMSLYEEMRERRLVPGSDILVFGYDNTAFASKISPTLSSVWTDIGELGEKALDIAIKSVLGETVSSVILPTKFVKRESFGGKKSRDINENEELENKIDLYFDSVFYRCRHEWGKEYIKDIKGVFSDLINRMLITTEIKDDTYAEYQKILYLTDNLLQYEILEYIDLDNLIAVFEEICNHLCHKCEDINVKNEIRELFSIIYRKFIHSMNGQFGTIQAEELHNSFSFKVFVSDIVQFEKGNDQSYMNLISGIDFLDIKNAGVYIFENPITHLKKESFERPKTVYLKAVLSNGVVDTVPSTHQKVKIQDIFKNSKITEDRYSMVLFPLFSNEILYGFIMCDLTEKLFENGEFVFNQMSSAAKMIDLLKSNERIQQKLEDSLVALRQNNIELDNLSRYDVLTGILNRRGFFDAAQTMLLRLDDDVKLMLVAYIDMNNLKIINDRYGHEEGDFSLKLIGDILTQTVNGYGIVGRIGGDEYACIMEYNKEDKGKSFVKHLYKAFDQFNSLSDKQYNITVSAGAYIINADKKVSLQEALSHADERLYEAKKKRVKIVAKSEFAE